MTLKKENRFLLNLLYTDPFPSKRGVDTQECTPSQKIKPIDFLESLVSDF